MGQNWIAGAIKHPGALRKQLGAKGDEPIPEGKLEAAAKKKTKGGEDTKVAKRARLTLTLKKMHHGDGMADGMQMGSSGFGMAHGVMGVAHKRDHDGCACGRDGCAGACHPHHEFK